jgi:hypothetical protein
LRAASPEESAWLSIYDVVAPDTRPDLLPNTSGLPERGVEFVNLANDVTYDASLVGDPYRFGYRVLVGDPGAAAEIVVLAAQGMCDSDLRHLLTTVSVK